MGVLLYYVYAPRIQIHIQQIQARFAPLKLVGPEYRISLKCRSGSNMKNATCVKKAAMARVGSMLGEPIRSVHLQQRSRPYGSAHRILVAGISCNKKGWREVIALCQVAQSKTLVLNKPHDPTYHVSPLNAVSTLPHYSLAAPHVTFMADQAAKYMQLSGVDCS